MTALIRIIMIKANQLENGSIIEFNKEQEIYVKDPNTMLSFHLLQPSDCVIVKPGERFEIVKFSKVKSAFTLQLKQVGESNENKTGYVWLSSIYRGCSLISGRESKEQYAANQIDVNDDEQIVIVNKNNPDWFLKKINPVAQNYVIEDGDIIEKSFVFNPKLSERHKIKSKKSLEHFLYNTVNYFDSNEEWQTKITNLSKYELYLIEHLLETLVFDINDLALEDMKLLELKKYNIKEKKIINVFVDNFDCFEYVSNVKRQFSIATQYGPAVSEVVNSIVKKNEISKYPYLFVAQLSEKFILTHNKHSENKDLYFEDAFTTIQMSKKDTHFFNKNSFVCVALQTQEQLDLLTKNYNHPDKKIESYLTQDIVEQYWIKNNKSKKLNK